jgi:hypothetical protein
MEFLVVRVCTYYHYYLTTHEKTRRRAPGKNARTKVKVSKSAQ